MDNSCALAPTKAYGMWGNLGMGNMWGHHGMDDYDKGYGMNDYGMNDTDGYHKGYGMNDTDGYHKGYGMDDYGMDDYGMDDYGMDDYGMDDYGMDDYGMDDYGMDDYGMDDYWEHPSFDLGEYLMHDILSYAAIEGTMTITGNALASAEPELLTIRLGVQTTNPTAGAALSENSRLMTSAVEAITALGIPEDELSTSRFNIEPRYESKYDENGNYVNVFVGYRVSNIIAVTTDQLDMAADIIDASVSAGANSVISVDFGVSPETEKSTRDGLIGKAVCDAVHKGELALKPMGYRITGVETMHIDTPGTHGAWRLASAQIAEEATFAGTPIFSGDQSFSASVTVTFFIGPW